MSMRLTKEERFEAMTAPILPGLYQTTLFLVSNRHRTNEILGDVYASAWKCFSNDVEEAGWRVRVFQILMQCVRQKRRGWMLNSTAALVQLPEAGREVVALIDGQGFTYREAAQVLDLSVESLSRTLTSARDFLLQKVSLEALPPQGLVQSDRTS